MRRDLLVLLCTDESAKLEMFYAYQKDEMVIAYKKLFLGSSKK